MSIADVQWVLHRASATAVTLKAEVKRDTAVQMLTLSLPKEWKRLDDISWRISTWEFRRMTLGALQLESITADDRKAVGLGEVGMALRVKAHGTVGPWAAAQNAGFRKGDILVAYDGQTNFERETDIFLHSFATRRPGDRVPVTVLRGGRKRELMLPIQP